MKNRAVLLSVIFFVYICSSALSADLDPDKFTTVDKIKPGMTGTGKTVFSGTKIEEFQIKVLDVVKNMNGPKSDLIWVECSGGPLAETGVISGMSGSPVYIDGKLIGAIAYRAGNFPKRPIAGVTPIADMLGVIENADKGGSSEQGMMDDLEMPFQLQGNSNNGDAQIKANFYRLNSGYLEPIQMPVAISGFSPKTIEHLTPLFDRFGMMPIQGGGSSGQSEPENVKLEPGAVICIQFVRGDADVSGSGTVTYVDGDKVLAFGHPMYAMGKTSLPVASGKISLLVPSMLASSKMGTPIQTIGTLIQDNQYGILMDISKKPEFIPVKVRVKSYGDTQVQEYNFEVVKHRLFSATFISSIALDAILAATKSVGEYTMKTYTEINVKGYPSITKRNVFSGLSPDIASVEFAAPLLILMQNRFEEIDLESFLLEISFEDKRTNAMIDNARISKSTVKPGDSIDIAVSITPYLQDTITKEFSVTIPKDMPEGRALLRISDASSSETWENTRAPMKSRPTSVSHIIKQIQEEESNNNIIVELFAQKPGMTVRGEELPALPLTALSVISSSNQSGLSAPTLGTTFLKQKIETDYVLIGSATLMLTIDQDAP